jgi:hypothetical protein
MNELTDEELEEIYNEWLDEVYGEVDIAGYKWATSHAFKEIDPTTYRCKFNDWLDREVQDGYIIEKENKYYKGK